MVFLVTHNVLSESQLGFRPGRSTDNAMYTPTRKVQTALSKNKKTFSPHFQTWKKYSILCLTELSSGKLDRIGIHGNAKHFVKQYLSNRKQNVKIEKLISNTSIAKDGIPQGAVPCPTFF